MNTITIVGNCPQNEFPYALKNIPNIAHSHPVSIPFSSGSYILNIKIHVPRAMVIKTIPKYNIKPMIPVSTHILTYQESVGIDVVKRLDTFTPKPSPDNPNPSPNGLYFKYSFNSNWCIINFTSYSNFNKIKKLILKSSIL